MEMEFCTKEIENTKDLIWFLIVLIWNYMETYCSGILWLQKEAAPLNNFIFVLCRLQINIKCTLKNTQMSTVFSVMFCQNCNKKWVTRYREREFFRK